jgi:hAT family C-terminal dimerisation region
LQVYLITEDPDIAEIEDTINYNHNFNVLKYWRQHEKLWSILASVTHDIYAIPVSTIPSESAFSASNRVLTDDRNRLGNKTFEMLVCLKYWLDAEVRDHDHSNMYDSFEYITPNPESSRYDSDNVPQDDNEDKN